MVPGPDLEETSETSVTGARFSLTNGRRAQNNVGKVWIRSLNLLTRTELKSKNPFRFISLNEQISLSLLSSPLLSSPLSSSALSSFPFLSFSPFSPSPHHFFSSFLLFCSSVLLSLPKLHLRPPNAPTTVYRSLRYASFSGDVHVCHAFERHTDLHLHPFHTDPVSHFS